MFAIDERSPAGSRLARPRLLPRAAQARAIYVYDAEREAALLLRRRPARAVRGGHGEITTEMVGCPRRIAGALARLTPLSIGHHPVRLRRSIRARASVQRS